MLDYMPKLYPPELIVAEHGKLVLHAAEEVSEVHFMFFLVLACAIYVGGRGRSRAAR